MREIQGDFINKPSGGIEEADESALWLELLTESGICAGSVTKPLWKEADGINNQQRINNRESQNQQCPQP